MLQSAIFNRLRILSPQPVRQWFKRQPWFAPVSKVVFGNGVYCDSYYADVERIEKDSVGPIAEWITKALGPSRLIDVGCGPGHMSAALMQRGVSVFAVDLSESALAATRRKGIPCQAFDLTAPDRVLPGIPYDVAMSCEVAEHLEEKFARRFVEHLTSAAPVVYLTAAEPDPSAGVGMYHVNEQPNSYWVQLFAERGYRYDATATQDARHALSSPEIMSYLRKPLVFRGA